MRESLISIPMEKNRDSHFSDYRAAQPNRRECYNHKCHWAVKEIGHVKHDWRACNSEKHFNNKNSKELKAYVL